jgi:hypothetical protein
MMNPKESWMILSHYTILEHEVNSKVVRVSLEPVESNEEENKVEHMPILVDSCDSSLHEGIISCCLMDVIVNYSEHSMNDI